MSKTYLINERNIFSYRTNQKEEILQNSKLNRSGFPNFWPNKNKDNQIVFISFVDAFILNKNGQLVDGEKVNFDILDTEKFNPDEEDSKLKLRYLSALLSPDYRVKGGIYFNGKFYTGQMRPRYAKQLYETFMHKYFSIQDVEAIKEMFAKDKNGNLLYAPIYDKEKNEDIIFSAVDASILDKKTNEIIAEKINFNIHIGQTFDLNKKEDLEIADTTLKMLNENYLVRGFYYRGNLIPDKLSKKFKLYLEKGFIKKNFTIEHVDYLLEHASKDENGHLIFMPMKNQKNEKIVISFRDGDTPLGEKYQNFDVYTNVPFNPRLEDTQNKIRIIEKIIARDPEYKGALYLDGILVPNKEKEEEILRRKVKVEKELKVRIDCDEDYMLIFNKFTIDDREKMLILSDYYRDSYPRYEGFVKKVNKELKNNNQLFVFDNVNILDNDGNYLFKENYSASYENVTSFNETEKQILEELFKKHSLVRGGIYYKGVNYNRPINFINKFLFKMFLKKVLTAEEMNKLKEASKQNGCIYKMDRKNEVFVHWPTFDKNGREALLSVVDANVWFKVGRHTVKAVNDMNFSIFAGETFGLVGESGSGKTTISRAILGINKLNKGGIYWKGKLISSGLSRKGSKMVKKNIQMIFQDPAASLNERANVDYIISEGLYSFHLFKNKEERLFKVNSVLKEVGLLPEHLSRYPHEFSGGQRQRIGIARALVINPELVLADEPISALDVSIRAQVLNLLKKLQVTDNLTYLFIAHDLSIIRYISDRIAVMHNGYTVELGVAEEIYENPIHPYTKSLLTAIPQPDPKTKNLRTKIVYEQGDIDYAKCHWYEVKPGHYVLLNEKMKKELNIK